MPKAATVQNAGISLFALMLFGMVALAAEPTGPRTLENLLAVADGEPQAAVVADEAPNEAEEPPAAPKDDPLQRRLDAALAEYNSAIETAIDEFAKEIEEEFDKATKKGDIARARKCKEAEEALRERGVPPEGDFLKHARENTERKVVRAGAKLAAEFEAVAKECLKAGDLDRAESVLSEKAELLAEMKSWKSKPSGVGGRRNRAVQTPTVVTSGQEAPGGPNRKEVRLDLRHQLEEPGLCSVTCASIALEYLGTKISPRALKVMSRGRDYNPNEPFNDFTGTLFKDLRAAVNRLGYEWEQSPALPNDAHGFKEGILVIKQALNVGRPVIVDLTNAFGQTGSHVFIVCGYSDRTGKVSILDPHLKAPGITEIPYEEFESLWNSLGFKDRPFNARGMIVTSTKPNNGKQQVP